MKRKLLRTNLGRFVDTGQEIVYVDDQENVWNQENLANIIKTFKQFNQTMKLLDHYKKYL